MRMFGWILVAIIVAALAYVRLAPTDPARWHQPVSESSDKTFAGGAVRVVPGDDDTLARLHQVALGTSRTQVLAGSPAEGRITYVTRSKWIGFPDYTTADLVDGHVRLLARLRFGRSDLGVNAERLERWLAEL